MSEKQVTFTLDVPDGVINAPSFESKTHLFEFFRAADGDEGVAIIDKSSQAGQDVFRSKDPILYAALSSQANQLAFVPCEATSAVIAALEHLLATGGPIAVASDTDLQEAIADPEADEVVKVEAKAILRAREALANVRTGPVRASTSGSTK